MIFFKVIGLSLTIYSMISVAGSEISSQGEVYFDAPKNLRNHGGPVMSEGINLHVIWVGKWNRSTVNLVESFLTSLGNQSIDLDTPNLGEWWSVLSQYNDPYGGYVTNGMAFKTSCFAISDGSGFSFNISNFTSTEEDLFVPLLNAGVLPEDENGVYLIMTDSQVNVR